MTHLPCGMASTCHLITCLYGIILLHSFAHTATISLTMKVEMGRHRAMNRRGINPLPTMRCFGGTVDQEHLAFSGQNDPSYTRPQPGLCPRNPGACASQDRVRVPPRPGRRLLVDQLSSSVL